MTLQHCDEKRQGRQWDEKERERLQQQHREADRINQRAMMKGKSLCCPCQGLEERECVGGAIYR